MRPDVQFHWSHQQLGNSWVGGQSPAYKLRLSLNFKGRCGVGDFYIDNRVAATTFTGEEFGHIRFLNSETQCIFAMASIAQLVEHALRKRTVVGSIPTGGFSLLFVGDKFWATVWAQLMFPIACSS